MTPHLTSADRQDVPPGERIFPELPAGAMLEVLWEVNRARVDLLSTTQIELDRLDMMSTLRAAERKGRQAATIGSREAAWQGFATHP